MTSYFFMLTPQEVTKKDGARIPWPQIILWGQGIGEGFLLVHFLLKENELTDQGETNIKKILDTKDGQEQNLGKIQSPPTC